MDSLKEAKMIGISHGDMKLADVVIINENGENKYKLIDFGLGHQMNVKVKKKNSNSNFNEKKRCLNPKLKDFHYFMLLLNY